VSRPDPDAVRRPRSRDRHKFGDGQQVRCGGSAGERPDPDPTPPKRRRRGQPRQTPGRWRQKRRRRPRRRRRGEAGPPGGGRHRRAVPRGRGRERGRARAGNCGPARPGSQVCFACVLHVFLHVHVHVCDCVFCPCLPVVRKCGVVCVCVCVCVCVWKRVLAGRRLFVGSGGRVLPIDRIPSALSAAPRALSLRPVPPHASRITRVCMARRGAEDDDAGNKACTRVIACVCEMINRFLIANARPFRFPRAHPHGCVRLYYIPRGCFAQPRARMSHVHVRTSQNKAASHARVPTLPSAR
jgi:hypothetical protein